MGSTPGQKPDAASGETGSGDVQKKSTITFRNGCLGCLGLLVILLIIGYFLPPRGVEKPTSEKKDSPSSSQAPPVPASSVDKAAAPQKPALELLSSEGTQSEFATTITGKIRNNSNRKYSYVQVVFTLYNARDEQVGTAMANTNNLEPGTVWSFKAIGMTGEGSRFKLSEITGF